MRDGLPVSQIRRYSDQVATSRPWNELVPKQSSIGGKQKMGGFSKQGNRFLRSLSTAGALAVIRYAKIHGTGHRP
jgi:transposase